MATATEGSHQAENRPVIVWQLYADSPDTDWSRGPNNLRLVYRNGLTVGDEKKAFFEEHQCLGTDCFGKKSFGWVELKGETSLRSAIEKLGKSIFHAQLRAELAAEAA